MRLQQVQSPAQEARGLRSEQFDNRFRGVRQAHPNEITHRCSDLAHVKDPGYPRGLDPVNSEDFTTGRLERLLILGLVSRVRGDCPYPRISSITGKVQSTVSDRWRGPFPHNAAMAKQG